MEHVRVFLNTGFINRLSLGAIWSNLSVTHFWYSSSFLFSLLGLVEGFVFNVSPLFITSTNVSDISSATPRKVASGKVSFLRLKFVSVICTLFAGVTVLAWMDCNVSWFVLCDTAPNLESTRAANIPWMGTVAGSMHTRGKISFLSTKSNLAVTTWRHLGAMVTSCAILTSHDLLFWVGLSKGVLLELCPLGLISALRVWMGFSLSNFSWGNTVRAVFLVPVTTLVPCSPTAGHWQFH
jgi:hypothetical protein